MMAIKRSVFFLLLAVIVVAQSWASDENRSGFIIGTGMGVGCTGVISEDSSGKQQMIDIGPALSFRIGYAPLDLFQIYVGFSFSMFRSDMFLGLFKPEWLILWPVLLPINIVQSSHFLFQLIGATFYLRPALPSIVLGGGIGASSVSDPFWNKTKASISGWLEGGVEFAGHFSAKLIFFLARIEQRQYYESAPNNPLFHSLALSAILTAEYCFY